jgi:hypothetical protein
VRHVCGASGRLNDDAGHAGTETTMTDQEIKKAADTVAGTTAARGCDCAHMTWCRGGGLDRPALSLAVEQAMREARAAAVVGPILALEDLVEHVQARAVLP